MNELAQHHVQKRRDAVARALASLTYELNETNGWIALLAARGERHEKASRRAARTAETCRELRAELTQLERQLRQANDAY